MLAYDEQRSIKKLGALPPRLRVAFAAACAERLVPAYVRFEARTGRGNSRELLANLERIWEDVEGSPMTLSEIDSRIDKCLSLIPCEDDGPWVEEQAVAEDAGAAVAYVLRCRKTGDSQEAAWAARRCYEALDRFIINRDKVDINIHSAEAAVLSDPLLQAEILRQERDLDELNTRGTEIDVVPVLRARAIAEAHDMFGGNT